jgi:hypothetical protein
MGAPAAGDCPQSRRTRPGRSFNVRAVADAPQLLFGSAVRVDVQAETTFGAFVRAQLLPRGIQGMVPDDASFASLLDEIWNADANQYLRQGVGDGDRGHAPAGDTTTATWCLYPDEWVYLPILEVQSPGWRIRRLTVSTSDAGRACDLIAQFCLEKDLVLPAVSGAPTSDATPAIPPDALEGYLYNSLLRRGLQSEFVYFYAASPLASNLDVPPSTPAGGVTTVNGRATPLWLPRFWHYIDRIRGIAGAHAGNARELHELSVDGRFVVAALGLLDKVLALYQRDCAPGPPPSGVLDATLQNIANAYSPDHGLTLDIDALRRALPDLRSKARRELVDTPAWPAIAHFNATLAQLKALETEDAFQEIYAQFDADRALYPRTAQAFQLALADFVNARSIDPDGDSAVLALLNAFLKGVAGDSPITKEIALAFSGAGIPQAAQARDEASAIANLTAFSVGNTPGPASLWVSLTRLGLVTSIGTFGPKAAGQTSSQWRASYRDYMARLAAASGITAATLAKLEGKAGITPNRQPGKLARAFASAAFGAEELAKKTQSGPWMTTGMGLLSLWGIYAGLKQVEDEKGGLGAYVMDGAAIAQAGGELAGAVVQVMGSPAVMTECSSIASFLGASFDAGKGMAMFRKLSEDLLGPALGTFVGLYGVAQVVQGATANGGVDWSKVGSGAGAFFQSAGYWADVLVTRQAKLLVTETAIEIAGVAVDAELLLGLGAAFNVAGIVVGVIVIAATHKDLVMKAAYALFTPGPQKWVDTVLKQLKVTKAIVTGSAALVNGISQAQAASDQSTYVTWMVGPDTEKALRALGLGDDDLSLLRSIPATPGG